MKKSVFITVLVLILTAGLCGCGAKQENENNNGLTLIETDYSDMDLELSDRDVDTKYDSGSSSEIVFSQGAVKAKGSGVKTDGTNATVTASGTYIISGSSDGGMILVNATDTDKIQLVLKGLTLKGNGGPAIYIKSADKVFITLEAGAENSLSDPSDYTYTDSDTTPDAVIFSKSDLTINGNGSLTVNGSYKHGIVSKDDLVISSAKITVKSQKTAINGKDCVKIQDAVLSLEAGTNGISSDNTEDSNRGFICVYSGKITVNSAGDAIQAETLLKIENGEINAVCADGSADASWNSGGFNDGWMGGRGGYQGQQGSDSGVSAKGLKAGGDIQVNGGSFNIDSSDDSVHSNSNIVINGGKFTLSSGDDGVHADSALTVSGGEISITKSYEGLEATRLDITGGNISVIAADDGINAAGGNDGSSLGGRPGQGGFSGSTGAINITGGYTVIDADGDGIDSNGTIDVSGGITLVSGPTSNGNCAFDHDGTATATGGILIAVGSAGMAETFNDAQNQGAVYCSFSSQNAGVSIALCDDSGKVLASFTPKKAYQSAVITAPDLKQGESYSLVSGATVKNTDSNGFAQNSTKTGGEALVSFTLDSLLYNSGRTGGMGGFGGMGGPGRR